jgi:hypothetical protein
MQARIIRTKTGLIHYGVYGDEDFENQPRVKRTVRGRPPVEAKPVYFKTNDLFGRVPLKAPKGKPGTVYAAKI